MNLNEAANSEEKHKNLRVGGGNHSLYQYNGVLGQSYQHEGSLSYAINLHNTSVFSQLPANIAFAL